MMRSDFDRLSAEIHLILSRKYARKPDVLPEKWCICSHHPNDIVASPSIAQEIIGLLREKLTPQELEDFVQEFPALESLEDLDFRCVSRRLLIVSLGKALFSQNQLQIQ